MNRQNTLERAILAAMGGQLQVAEQAVYDAERLEVSAGEIRLLRGQIALYSGKPQDAIDHLEKAVALMPRSVAAQGALAVAYGMIGPWEKWQKPLRKIDQLTPSSSLDYLFKAWAEAFMDPVSGLKTLDTGFGNSPPILARLVRADLGWQAALFSGQIGYALQPPTTPKPQSSPCPATRLPCTPAPSHGWQPRSSTKQTARRRNTTTPWPSRVRKPKRSSNLAYPGSGIRRWYYYRQIGQEQAVLDELRRVYEQTNHPGVAYYYALVLYHRQDLERASEVVESPPATSSSPWSAYTSSRS